MKQNFFSGKFIYTEINLKDIFTVNSRNVFKNLKINIYGFSYFSSFSNIKFVHFCDTFFRHREVFSGCKKIVLKSKKVKIFRIKWVILVIFGVSIRATYTIIVTNIIGQNSKITDRQTILVFTLIYA